MFYCHQSLAVHFEARSNRRQTCVLTSKTIFIELFVVWSNFVCLSVYVNVCMCLCVCLSVGLSGATRRFIWPAVI